MWSITVRHPSEKPKVQLVGFVSVVSFSLTQLCRDLEPWGALVYMQLSITISQDLKERNYMGVVEIQVYGHDDDDDDLMVLNMSGAADETLGEAGSGEVSAQFKPTLRMKLKVSGDDLVV